MQDYVTIVTYFKVCFEMQKIRLPFFMSSCSYYILTNYNVAILLLIPQTQQNWHIAKCHIAYNQGWRNRGHGGYSPPHFLRFVNWEDKPATVLTWVHKHAISLIHIEI